MARNTFATAETRRNNELKEVRPMVNGGLVTRDKVGFAKRHSTIKALDKLYLEGSRTRNATWILSSLERGLTKLLSYQVEKRRVVVDKMTGVQNLVHLVDRGLCYGWQERRDRNGNLEKVYILPAASIVYTVKQEVDLEMGRYLFAVYCRKIGSDNAPAWMTAGSVYGETFEKDAERLNEMVSRICALENLEPLD